MGIVSTLNRLFGRRVLPGVTQPWNRIVFPWQDAPNGPHLWNMATALQVPWVAHATSIYSGMIKQIPLDDDRGIQPLPRPRLLEQPDPNMARSLFVQLQIEDYLWHGNALSIITHRDAATGWPLAVMWIPAEWVQITSSPELT